MLKYTTYTDTATGEKRFAIWRQLFGKIWNHEDIVIEKGA